VEDGHKHKNDNTQKSRTSSYINPLTPDLNPAAERQPAEVFKFYIQFLTLTLRKKFISHTHCLQISGNKIAVCL
jgi:hypothetical protein